MGALAVCLGAGAQEGLWAAGSVDQDVEVRGTMWDVTDTPRSLETEGLGKMRYNNPRDIMVLILYGISDIWPNLDDVS